MAVWTWLAPALSLALLVMVGIVGVGATLCDLHSHHGEGGGHAMSKTSEDKFGWKVLLCRPVNIERPP
jgi:hypothetical protein